jgi:hypothetical protein
MQGSLRLAYQVAVSWRMPDLCRLSLKLHMLGTLVSVRLSPTMVLMPACAVILNSNLNMLLPNVWLWDMVDEFVYQFQSFCQYR